MGYYIRVLGEQDPDIHLDDLIENLRAEGMVAHLSFAKGDLPNKWSIIEVANEKGERLAQIERNPVLEGQLGKDELEEFIDSLENSEPESAAIWLREFFIKVKVIYAFQLLNAAFHDANFPIVSSLKSTIWNKTGGILQADHEGFSNEDGYHILWQFSDDVTGEWACATKNAAGNWDKFIMDLGDHNQRQEFLNGYVPIMAKRL